MLKHIRVASQEEVEKIRDSSDLGKIYSVFAMENKSGDADIAVVKQVFEVDPVFYAGSTNDIQKARFLWGLEERLLGAGIEHYYFNVKATDLRWQQVVKEWGAIQQSSEPELRFGKSLR